MQSIATIRVSSVLPDALKPLESLSRNIWWSWTPSATELFEAINPVVWSASNHNPVRVLRECSQADLERVASDKDYLKKLETVHKAFTAYMTRKDTWFKTKFPDFTGSVAYFSMEYGFHESFQIYSGGLGVLAGDHCKSASDLDLPFCAVGLLYREGYFHQQLDVSGWQFETFENIVPDNMPLELVKDAHGNAIKVQVEVSSRTVTIQAWKLAVGRINVYLLDSNVPENSEKDRFVTAQLYDSGRRRGVNPEELRVAQELVLGVGGVRMLRAIGNHATVYHMNEGHAAFLGLERIREYMQQGLSFAESLEVVSSSAIFTTHTPVPAGNDAFPQAMVEKKLVPYWTNALGISRDELFDLALHHQPWGPTFSMTVLALRMSRFANGVSELHGQVSRGMWGFLWAGVEAPEVPITHVTNGIHTRTFLAKELAALYDKAFGKNWDDTLEQAQTWKLDKISDDDLWNTRQALKSKLIRFTRARLHRQNQRNNAVTSSEHVLREDALTIGFARRFATYKRATMLFKDLERLKRIVNHVQHPVQFIFAGKAHPADNPGKEFIQALYRFSQDPDLKGKVVFLEDYDMNVAKHLVQGCDIWLNNPRRPLEASGTSGEKASLNGCINFSILDGWWREAYDGTNGWAIGDETEYGSDDASLKAQDDNDAQSLYDTLEFDIAPRYYNDRHAWLETVRRNIQTIAPQFSMQRQVIDYVNTLYIPAQARGDTMRTADYAAAKSLAAWKHTARATWNDVRLEASLEGTAVHAGGTVTVKAKAWLGNEQPVNVQIQAVLARPDGKGQTAVWHTPLSVTGTRDDGWLEYSGVVTIPEAGEFQIGVRALPYRDDLAHPLELSLLRWA
jgi:glycogen phosphorylase